MGRIIVIIGAPGSGKSFFRELLLDHYMENEEDACFFSIPSVEIDNGYRIKNAVEKKDWVIVEIQDQEGLSAIPIKPHQIIFVTKP